MVLRIRRRGGGSKGKVDWTSGLLYRIQGQNSPVRAHSKARGKAKREMDREMDEAEKESERRSMAGDVK